jgi:hypothetical protein
MASPYEFARFATLSAALAMMAAIINPLVNELAQRVSVYRGISTHSLRTRAASGVGMSVLIALCACAHIVDTPLEAFSIYVLLPILFVAHSGILGVLSGLHRMTASGCALLASSTIRLVILVPFLLWAPTLLGVSLAYVGSFITTIALARMLTSKHLQPTTAAEWNTNWALVAGFFLLTLPFSLDQPIIQALFTETAAEYAALMTYAKSVMLLATPALMIAYSSALQTHKEAANTSRSIRPIATVVGLASTLSFLLWIVSPWLFPLLLGPKYTHVIPWLGITLIAMTLHVISYFLIQQLLLTSSFLLSACLLLPSLVQALLLGTRTSPTLEDLAYVSVSVFALQLLIATAGYFAYRSKTKAAL